MSLYRLIYSSKAKENITPQDLRDILDVSEKNNIERGISGFLCYSNGVFLQVLEGDCDELNQLYHYIVTDNRHHSPRIIECVPMVVRQFEAWSMQAISLNDLATEQVKSIVLKHSGSPRLRPEVMSPEQCLNFLLDIAKIFQLSDNFLLDF